MLDVPDKSQRVHFLLLAFAVEGGVLIVALAAAWILGQAPWEKLRLSFDSVALAIVATIPMLIFLAFTYYTRIRCLVQFRELTRELIQKPLAACSWLDVCAIALSAGISEEFLFRGVVEPSLRSLGPLMSVLVCNLFFGVCHALTKTYFVFATIVGIYLSLTMRWTNEPNLIVPIGCHALYDLVALQLIRFSSRKSDAQDPPSDNASPEPEISPDCPVFLVSQ